MGINSKLDREIDRQKEKKKVFEEKIAKLEIELISSNNTIKKMNTGSKALDEMLSFQKTASDRTGLGYQGSNSKSQKNAGKTVFVKVKPIDPLPQLEKKNVQFTPICHNCGIVIN